MACAYLTDLANRIWNDIGEPSSPSVSAIQAKLTSASFLGRLNVLISTCFALESGDITPEMGIEEQAIYALMYKGDYYAKKITENLAASAVSWTTIKEGDTAITRVAETEKAKVFKDLKRQTDEQLVREVGFYKSHLGTPRAINFENPPPS